MACPSARHGWLRQGSLVLMCCLLTNARVSGSHKARATAVDKPAVEVTDATQAPVDLGRPWRGVREESLALYRDARDRAPKGEARKQALRLGGGVAAGAVLFYLIAWRCFRQDFTDAPQGLRPEQPLAFFVWNGGTLWIGAVLFLDVCVDFFNVATLWLSNMKVTAFFIAFFLFTTMLFQLIYINCQPFRLFTELGRTLKMGVTSSRVALVYYAEAALAAPATGFLATTAALFLPPIPVAQAAALLVGWLESARLMSKQALAHHLGAHSAASMEEVAARAAMAEAGRGWCVFGIWSRIVFLVVLGQIAAFAIIARVVHTAAALLLFLFIIVGEKLDDPTKSCFCSVLADTTAPILMLAPGGSGGLSSTAISTPVCGGSSVIGLNNPARRCVWRYVAQFLRNTAAVGLCYAKLPEVQGVHLGREVFLQEFVEPIRGLALGGIHVSEVPCAGLRAALLAAATLAIALEMLLFLFLLLRCSPYLFGGDLAMDRDLIELKVTKQAEMKAWFDARCGEEPSAWGYTHPGNPKPAE